jgi:hypothetical protein
MRYDRSRSRQLIELVAALMVFDNSGGLVLFGRYRR